MVFSFEAPRASVGCTMETRPETGSGCPPGEMPVITSGEPSHPANSGVGQFSVDPRAEAIGSPELLRLMGDGSISVDP